MVQIYAGYFFYFLLAYYFLFIYLCSVFRTGCPLLATFFFAQFRDGY